MSWTHFHLSDLYYCYWYLYWLLAGFNVSVPSTRMCQSMLLSGYVHVVHEIVEFCSDFLYILPCESWGSNVTEPAFRLPSCAAIKRSGLELLEGGRVVVIHPEGDEPGLFQMQAQVRFAAAGAAPAYTDLPHRRSFRRGLRVRWVMSQVGITGADSLGAGAGLPRPGLRTATPISPVGVCFCPPACTGTGCSAGLGDPCSASPGPGYGTVHTSEMATQESEPIPGPPLFRGTTGGCPRPAGSRVWCLWHGPGSIPTCN